MKNSTHSGGVFTRTTLHILLVVCFAAISAIANAQTTVTSDKEDYPPLSHAVFTGSGFAPNEQVVLKVKNLNQPCHTVAADSSYFPWTVTADEIGSFTTDWTVCNCPGDSLRLKATGQSSGVMAYAYFTDAAQVGTVTVSAQSPNPICPGSSATYTVTLTRLGNGGGSFPVTLSITGLPAGASGSFTPVTFAGSDNSKTSTLTIVTDAISTPFGSTNFTVKATPPAAGVTSTGTLVVSPLTPSVSIGITSGVNPTCSGSGVTFTATPTNGGSPSYQWKKDGVNVGTNSATYTDAGTTGGSITCVLTTSLTCVTSTTATSNAIALNTTTSVTPSVSIVITSGVNPTCSGSGVTFTATPTNGGTPSSYQWKKGGVNVGTNSATYTDAGTTGGSITCVLTTSLTCVTSTTATSNAIALSVNARPTSTITGTQSICSGGSASLSIAVTGTGPWSGTLSNGAAFSGSSSPISVSVTPSSTTTYTVASLSDANCSGTNFNGSATVTVSSLPTVSIDNNSPIDVCYGTSPSVKLTGTGNETVTYNLNGGSDQTIVLNNGGNGSIVISSIITNTTVALSSVTANGCTTTFSPELSVTVTLETTAPLVTAATDVVSTTSADGAGNCTTAIAISNATFSDACPGAILSWQMTGATTGSGSGQVGTMTFNKGATTITYTVTDAVGLTATDAMVVALSDNELPAITCPANISVNGTSAAGAAVTYVAPVGTDNCGGATTSLLSGLASGSTFPLGSTIVTYEAEDASGNKSQCSFTVSVTGVPPVIACPVDISVSATAGLCGAEVVFAANETTGIPESTITYSVDPGSFFSVGTTTVTATATNAVGSSSCTFDVTVTDNEAPLADVASLATVTGECSASVSAPTLTDNCEGTITGTTSDATSYSEQGTYSITWTYDDGNGNTSTQTQTVTVDDVTAPVADVSSLPTVTGECSASVSAPTATDNCEGTITGATSDATSYSEQGTYSITWTYDDGNGNTSTQTQTVIVDDVTAPVADVSSLPTVTGECSASVSAPTATDNCEGTITGATSDATSYSEQGTYSITWTYDDGNGNTSTQTQTVTVDDVTAPVADVSSLAIVTGECSASVSAPTSTDNCEGTITGTTSDATSYSEQGTYSITWTYDDGNGNTSTQTQTVIVDDVTAPVADVSSLATVTGECSASVSAPTSTDNCEGTITGTTSDATSYSEQGTYTITWTYNDGNGNISTQTQTVIVDDVTAPVADASSLATVTGECSASVSAPTATDNCEGTITGTTSDATSYSEQGTYSITWTYDDGNGNTSTQTQTVIVDDVTAPVADVASLATATGECSASVSAPTATDNCEGTITGTTSDATSYSEQGTYSITWTYDDGNGNTSTQAQTVIVDDVTAPVADVSSLATVTGECSASASAPTATDNCEGTITGTTSDATSYSEQGTYSITWTYDDGNGNTSTQTQTIVVDDVTPPVIVSLPNIILSACTVTASWATPTVTDNCTVSSVVQTAGPASGSTFANGTTTTITYTATDGGDNQVSSSFTVTRASVLTASSSSTAILCYGGTSTVTVSASGGTAPYAGTGTFSVLAGTHTFTVTDANGCTAITTGMITQPTALSASISTNNPTLYFGYSGDQTATITAFPSGGTAPYKVSITMVNGANATTPARVNGGLICNYINTAGDEIWTASSGTTVSNACGLAPVSTKTGIGTGGSYSVNVTLLVDARFIATITDANGCTYTIPYEQAARVDAEDVRCFAGNSNVQKVQLCHRTGSSKNPCVTICVDESAVAEHIAHGDFYGKCNATCTPPVTNARIASTDETENVMLEELSIETYPNPFKTFVSVQVSNPEHKQVAMQMVDVAGRSVITKNAEYSADGMYQLDTENLQSGLYILRVTVGNYVKTLKLMKE